MIRVISKVSVHLSNVWEACVSTSCEVKEDEKDTQVMLLVLEVLVVRSVSIYVHNVVFIHLVHDGADSADFIDLVVGIWRSYYFPQKRHDVEGSY